MVLDALPQLSDILTLTRPFGSSRLLSCREILESWRQTATKSTEPEFGFRLTTKRVEVALGLGSYRIAVTSTFK